MSTTAVTLSEWETRGPDSGTPLAGWTLEGNEVSRRLAGELTKSGRFDVLELARGIELRATSYIGRFSLGGMSITVQPKLTGAPFLNLLRYAYGLRQLHLYAPASYDSSKWSFQDLLIWQLATEVDELLSRGVHREYERTQAELANLRGRIDFGRLVGMPHRAQAELPCAYYPRIEDTRLNQVLLAGLVYASHSTSDRDLRSYASSLAKRLNTNVSTKRLTGELIVEARSTIDRRTSAYESALIVIELFYQAEGISLDDDRHRVQLPGFLFDMNRFFQSLVSRFLHDHLHGYEVHDEHRLKGLFSYNAERNPRKRRAPTQRPDFVVRLNGQVTAIIDAKYRDLWENPLPREMLYQLALYALGQGGNERKAIILYPTLSSEASEQVVFIHEPIGGVQQAQVVLRPVHLLELDKLLRDGNWQAHRRKTALAHHLAFGAA